MTNLILFCKTNVSLISDYFSQQQIIKEERSIKQWNYIRKMYLLYFYNMNCSLISISSPPPEKKNLNYIGYKLKIFSSFFYWLDKWKLHRRYHVKEFLSFRQYFFSLRLSLLFHRTHFEMMMTMKRFCVTIVVNLCRYWECKQSICMPQCFVVAREEKCTKLYLNRFF